jgi:hypothetical protein
MSDWSLPKLLESLHNDIQCQLKRARESFAHPGAKGDASELVWLEMLRTYLPQRYRAEKGFVVDSRGKFSEQIDVIVFDRQYSPFIFHALDQMIVPAESVYAVFEVKQEINAELVAYARKKATSVRRLHRTSLPIPYAEGVYPPKPLIPILGGILTLDSGWNPWNGDPLRSAIKDGADEADRLDLGCVAAHGCFVGETTHGADGAPRRAYEFFGEKKPATAFLFKLISKLQFSGTVPMLDLDAYAKWLAV